MCLCKLTSPGLALCVCVCVCVCVCELTSPGLAVCAGSGAAGQHDQSSLAEEGLVAPDDSSGSDGELPQALQQQPDSPHGADSPLVPRSVAGGDTATAVSEAAVSEMGVSEAGVAAGGEPVTYENQAFNPELALSASLSGSEHGLPSDLLSANDVSASFSVSLSLSLSLSVSLCVSVSVCLSLSACLSVAYLDVVL